MNIWIVEDRDTDALNAANAVLRALADADETPRSVRLWRNSAVHWGAPLRAIDVSESGAALTDRLAPEALKQLAPTIAVLDLFDSGDVFTAGDFLQSLRDWEQKNKLPKSYVVLWSIWSGETDVQHFVKGEPARDPQVCWLDTKDTLSLKLRFHPTQFVQ